MAGIDPVKYRVEDSIGVIRLDRPETHNCLSSRAFEIVGEALREFEARSEVRAVLIRSSGKNFCTGADLAEVRACVEDRKRLQSFIRNGHDTLVRVERSPLPTVCAIQGLCLAGGLELVLSCDVAVAGRSAKFGDQHSRYGLVPGWGGSQRLPRTIGPRRALDLCLSARWIDAAQAEAWGLINYVVDDDVLISEAESYCRSLCGLSATGLRDVKRLIREGSQTTLENGLDLEAQVAVAALTAPDAGEGLAAFAERRKPDFAPRH